MPTMRTPISRVSIKMTDEAAAWLRALLALLPDAGERFDAFMYDEAHRGLGCKLYWPPLSMVAEFGARPHETWRDRPGRRKAWAEAFDHLEMLRRALAERDA